MTSDILGGKNAGIATVWFNPHDEKKHTDITPDFEIHMLCELITIVESI